MSDIEQRLRDAMDGVTPGPWGWVIHDHSMASLGVLPDPGLGDPLVMCVSPCGSCQERADPKEWEWGRCHTPSETDAAYIALCSPDNIGALLDTIASLRSKLEEAEGARPKNIEKTADRLAVSLGFLIRDWLTGPKPLEGDKLEYIIKMRIRRLLTEAAIASLREADHA